MHTNWFKLKADEFPAYFYYLLTDRTQAVLRPCISGKPECKRAYMNKLLLVASIVLFVCSHLLIIISRKQHGSWQQMKH